LRRSPPFYLFVTPPSPTPPLFPYTTLFRSNLAHSLASHRRDTGFNNARKIFQSRRKNIAQLFGHRLNSIRHFVKHGNDAAKKRWRGRERRREQRLAKTPHRRTNILQRANRSAAKLLSDRTSRLSHRRLKLGKPNLASRSHLKDFIRSHAKLVSQRLINGQTTIRHLRQNIVLRLADRRNLIKDAAHLIHIGTGGRCGVSD